MNDISTKTDLEWTVGETHFEKIFGRKYPRTFHTSTNGIWEILETTNGYCSLYFRAWRELDSHSRIGGGTLEQAKTKAQLLQDVLDYAPDS
jgi:hypothetical protein